MTTIPNPDTQNTANQTTKPIEEINFEQEFCKMPDIILPDNKFKLINYIDLNQTHLLLSTKTGLYLFDLKHTHFHTPKTIVQGNTTHAAFIPGTPYIAYALQNPNQSQNLYIFNLAQQKLSARIKIDSPIDQIKPTSSCIAMASLQQIFILHFPSLKPIHNTPAGNKINLIFDLSLQGLTLAYNSFNRGQLVIRNFTNIERNHAMTERKKSIYSSRLRPSNLKPSESIHFSTPILQEPEIEPIIYVKAHSDLLSQIKVSPNGSKVVTCSLKGTVLRVFSTKNGDKLQQFRVSHQISKIVDVAFVKDGNILGCMNNAGAILLYNVSMDKQQAAYETQRKGHKIYTQPNPKSFFSFLSFFYPSLNDSFSFNHFQLINPEFNEDSAENIDSNFNNSFSKSFSKSDIDDQKSDFKENDKFNHSIEEVEEEHLEDLGLEKNGVKSHSFKSSSSFLSKDINQTIKDGEKSSQPSSKGIQNHNDKKAANEPKLVRSSTKVQISTNKKNNGNSPSRTTSLINRPRASSRQQKSRVSSRQTNVSKRRGSSITKMQKEQVDQKEQKKYYNLISRLYITDGNYIWAVKGYHVFGLKYDSFHGGEMVLDRSMKLP